MTADYIKTALTLLLCFIFMVSAKANTPEPTSALMYQQTTNTRIVVEENHLRFFTGGSERMTIDVNGKTFVNDTLVVNTIKFNDDTFFSSGEPIGEGARLARVVYSFEGSWNQSSNSFGVRVSHSKNATSHTHLGEYLVNLSSRNGGELYYLRVNGDYNNSYKYHIERLSGNVFSDDVQIIENNFNNFNLEIRFHGSSDDWHRVTVTELTAPRGARLIFEKIDPAEFVYTGTKVISNRTVGEAIFNNNVGIGTTSPSHKLHVAGNIHGQTYSADSPPTWPDYVFEESYELNELDQVEEYIEENHHLPEIPSAAEVAANGIDIVDMQAKLLQKIEELTLYVIEQNKRIDRLTKENQNQSSRLELQSSTLDKQQKQIEKLKSNQ